MKYLPLLLVVLSAPAMAQTRTTNCNAATPNNAICVESDAVTVYSDGTPIASAVAVTYRLERRIGTTGTWTAVATQASPQFYLTNLAPGTYYFRSYAIASGAESVASNIANRDATSITPGAPVIRVTKVTISSDKAPVYDVLLDESDFTAKRGRQVGSVRVGLQCDADRTTGDGYYALVQPARATLTKTSRSVALVARCA